MLGTEFVVVWILLIIFTYLIITRILAHRERLAMINKGLQPSDVRVAPVSSSTTRGSQLRGALTTTMVGLALVIGLGTLGFGPWLLGGLIPMFIGVTQLIVYVAGGEGDSRGRTEEADQD